MSEKSSFWKKIGLHDWFLSGTGPEKTEKIQSVTPGKVYDYIVQQFQASMEELSFANRTVFYHEYIVVFNNEDYQEFIDHKKGLFGLLAQEAVKRFAEILKDRAAKGTTVLPSASKWVFRFVAHPDYARGDLGFIGRLLPGNTQKTENLRVTYIPRQTGIAETSDLSAETLEHFSYYSEGYYELPFSMDELQQGQRATVSKSSSAFARFEVVIPDKAYAGKKIEYHMTDEEIIVTGPADQRKQSDVFAIPSEWVDTPHLKIRYSQAEDKFHIASFGEKTLVNEKEVFASDPKYPSWTVLPLNSRIVLNGIIGINMFKAGV